MSVPELSKHREEATSEPEQCQESCESDVSAGEEQVPSESNVSARAVQMPSRGDVSARKEPSAEPERCSASARDVKCRDRAM